MQDYLKLGLPQIFRVTMGIELAEFLAEEEQIEIVCNRNIPEIRLLTGLIGPFRPLQRQTVPLVSCQEYMHT